ncbi:hypothetical protein [Bacillus sp. AK031]
MTKHRKGYLFSFLFIGIIALLLTSYSKDQPIRDIAWQYIEKNNWEQDGAGKWTSTVSTTTASDKYHLYDTTYIGKEVYKVEFFGGDGLIGIPAILISKDKKTVVGIIPTE